MTKKPQGRKKIEIKKIEGVNNRQVTFSKRRVGLFKKTSELCILTGAHAAIIVHSPGGRVYAFGHPTVDGVLDRFLNSESISDGSRNQNQKAEAVKEFSEYYLEVSKELEVEKKRRGVIQESKTNNGGELAWYGESVDGLGVEELEQYLSSLVELKRKVLLRADELMMIKKAPAMLLNMGQPNDIPVMENLTAAPAAGYGGLGHALGTW